MTSENFHSNEEFRFFINIHGRDDFLRISHKISASLSILVENFHLNKEFGFFMHIYGSEDFVRIIHKIRASLSMLDI